MDLKIRDKVALVTGGSRGIGRATALRLAEEGCKVGFCARGQDGVDRTVVELRVHGGEVYGMTADVSREGETECFIENAASALGGVDILINNVGGSAGSRNLIDSTDEDWRRTFDLNLFHAVRAVRAVFPYMQDRGGGSVITIASISGWKPAPEGAQYGSSKAAEMYLAGGLALELAPHNIRVNTVCPGSLLFPGGGWERFRNENPEAFAAFTSREFPSCRLGTDFEVADVIVFLSSERANWVNGASIPVDGAQGRPTAF